MGREEYSKAFRLGKKDYQSRMLHGVKPTLQVLDDIMPEKGSYSEQTRSDSSRSRQTRS